MKCIHFYMPDNRVVRVSDADAEEAVSSGDARYVPKSLWKRKGRKYA